MLYRISHEDGERLVSDPRVAATAYTGSRPAGLALKEAADRVGKPIYLEMSSVNPVVILPDAAAHQPELATVLAGSMLLGGGQFCTSPGLIFVPNNSESSVFVERLVAEVSSGSSATLLSVTVAAGLESALNEWTSHGAKVIASSGRGPGVAFPNTLLRITAEQFADNPELFQAEAFGNIAILVRYNGLDSLSSCLAKLEGNLTGTVFGRGTPGSDLSFDAVASILRPRVGRLLFNKPPTGVAVVDGMNHGGPYPSTGHPTFTAVGIPASLERFCMLQSFDNVPDDLLPQELRADNPLGLQRRVNGVWTDEPFEWQ
jgi:NADP-dependent aldehyde dehydrogenase